MTLKKKASNGIITDEIKIVAEYEGLDPDYVRDGIAMGTIVIPKNNKRVFKHIMGIGKKIRTKVNANIGNSAVTSDAGEELEKLHTAVHFGSDTVMYLSTGHDIDAIRQAIIDASPVPIGTVPI